jgi:ABC-type nickel/cobalt efflux system permease component RcnA
MFEKENWPGIALLGICAVVAIGLLIEIFTDIRWEFTGPDWLANGISILGLGIVAFMAWRAWGHRLRGRDKHEQSWPKDDVRNQRRTRGEDNTEPPA